MEGGGSPLIPLGPRLAWACPERPPWADSATTAAAAGRTRVACRQLSSARRLRTRLTQARFSHASWTGVRARYAGCGAVVGRGMTLPGPKKILLVPVENHPCCRLHELWRRLAS